MKINKILIPSISLIGLTSVIPTVACTKTKNDSFPFKFITDISDIKIEENWDKEYHSSSTECTEFEYSEFPIKFGYKDGRKFKETDDVVVFIDAEEFNAAAQTGDFDLRYGGILANDESYQPDGTIQFNAQPYVEHTCSVEELPDSGDLTNWSFTFNVHIRVNKKDYRLENAGKISGFVTYKEV